MVKKQKKKEDKKKPPQVQAADVVHDGPLYLLARNVNCYTRPMPQAPSMGRSGWACVSNSGEVFLNPDKEGTIKEWQYVISHCLLHLGFDHFHDERKDDPLWAVACDMVIARFLRDSHIGNIPAEISEQFPFSFRDEEDAYEKLKADPDCLHGFSFSVLPGGRGDMLYLGKRKTVPSYLSGQQTDYPSLLALSLQHAMREALSGSSDRSRDAASIPNTPYHRAREWFISEYPLLGALAASFKIIDDETVLRSMDVSVAAISPFLQELYLNPRCRLSDDEWKFVLGHEFLHAALRHDVRCEDRNPTLWNVACDYVVNLWLCEMNVGLMPEFALYDESFRGMSVENVYDALFADIRYYTGLASADILYGEPGWWDRLENQGLDEFYRSALSQGLEYHQEKGRGFLPGGLIEEIRAVLRPPIPWDIQLAQWFDEHFEPAEKRRTYARLSRRQSSTPDIPRPAWYQPEEPVPGRTFGVVLDTSGSMERPLLAAALGSIVSYSEARDVHHVRVEFCDAAAYDQGVMTPEEIAGTVKVRGRGGTKLQPGIDLLLHDPKFPKDAPMLVITDGECDRLSFNGREHAFLIPSGCSLPFRPKGKVFRLK